MPFAPATLRGSSSHQLSSGTLQNRSSRAFPDVIWIECREIVVGALAAEYHKSGRTNIVIEIALVPIPHLWRKQFRQMNVLEV